MSSAGQALGTVAGAIVGFYLGGPSGAIYGAQLGGMAGTAIDPPKGPNLTGPRLQDLTAQSSTYGAAIPRVRATFATYGNVIWLEGNSLKEVERSEQVGGKGGGGATSTTFAYYATFAVGLCKGPIAGIGKIWIGNTLVFDARSASLSGIIASGEFAASFQVYLGTEDQLPDPRIQADRGVDNTPAYRGLAYIVFYDYPLADHGNSLMGAQVKVEVFEAGSASTTWVDVPHNLPEPTPYPSVWPVGAGAYYHDGLINAFSRNTGNVPVRRVSVDGQTWTQVPNYYGMPSGFSQLHAAELDGVLYLLVYDAASTYSLFRFSGGGLDLVCNLPAKLLGYNAPTYGFAAWNGALYFLGYVGSVSNGDYRVYRLNMGAAQVGDPDPFDEVGVVMQEPGRRIYGVAAVGERLCVMVSDINLSPGLQVRTTTDLNTWAAPGGWFGTASGNSRMIAAGDKLVVWGYYSSTTWCFEVDPLTGAATDIKYATAFNFYDFVFAQQNYFGLGSTAFNAGTHVWHLRTSFTPADITLQEVVEDLCAARGATIDASDLDDVVRGYRLANPGSVRAALEPLQAMWPFDVIQDGYTLRTVRRGGAPAVTIQARLLDARAAGDTPGVQLSNSREMDEQLPRMVTLAYVDATREYGAAEQNAERLVTASSNSVRIEAPVVMTADEAAQRVEVLLYMYWLERNECAFRLPPEYLGLQPADVIEIATSDASYTLRLTEVSYLPDGRLECRARYASQAVYESQATGDEGNQPSGEVPLEGPSAYVLLDVPALVSSLDQPAMLAAMCGYTEGWPGGVLYRSVDAGQTWADLQAWVNPCAMGTALNTLGAKPSDCIDAASLLSVRLLSGTLASVTELAMLNGANHFAYGVDGRWEIIAARNCVLQPDGSYMLSDLLRGRFGTEANTGTHALGDTVVLLSDPDVGLITLDVGAIGLERQYRGITIGKPLDSDSNRAHRYQAINLECLSPVYLNGNRHPSTNDWSLTWVRRTRVGGEWRDYVDAALGETSEAYEIDICTAGFAAVKRTLTSTTPAASYTSAQQVTDFGSNQATLYLRIYQMSAVMGRGFPLQTTITR